MSDPTDPLQILWIAIADELDELSPRLEALERRRGLSPLHFGRPVKELTPQERLDATIALARWRLERLEAFGRLN